MSGNVAGRILITGATGFIGSHLTRQLAASGHEIYVLLQPGASLSRISDVSTALHVIPGDVLSAGEVAACLAEAKPDLCFHLAWYVEPGKYLSSEMNLDHLEAGVRLARQLAAAGCRKLVATGTCFEYDTAQRSDGRDRLSEESPKAPHSLYAACKLSLQQVLEQLSARTGMAVAWPRLFYQYGPFEDERRLVPSIILALLEGRTAALTPGEQVRDYLHVEDVASAIIATGLSPLTGPVNIGSGVPVTVREIAETLGRNTGRPDLLALGARDYSPDDPRFVCADNRKLVGSTAWSPRWSLEAGLTQTLEWFRQGRPDASGSGSFEDPAPH
jgi:nucleoside-diphosphate-sugar epimerase